MKKISIQIKGTMKSLIRSRAFLLLEQHGKKLERDEAEVQLTGTEYAETTIGFFDDELLRIGEMILEIHSKQRNYNILLEYFACKQKEKETTIKSLIEKTNEIIECTTKMPRVKKEVLESGTILTTIDSTTLEMNQDLVADYRNQLDFINDCMKEIKLEKERKNK